MNAERRIAIIRDQVLFLGGLAGIGYQQLTGNVSTTLLIVFTTMIGLPGLTNVISLLRGGGATESPPPSSPSSDSSTGPIALPSSSWEAGEPNGPGSP